MYDWFPRSQLYTPGPIIDHRLNMIQSHLLLAECSGCVVTTSQTQAPPPGSSNVLSDLHTEGDEQLSSPATSESGGLWSCSGVILDRSIGIVICHAAVFFPFFKESDSLSSFSEPAVILGDNLPSNVLIQVECPLEPKLATQPRARHDNHSVLDQRSGLGLVPVSKPQPQRMQCNAELLLLLPCPEFQMAFSRLFRKEDGWAFSSEGEKEYGELQKDLAYLHWFAVLKLQSPLTKAKANMDIMKSSSLVKGGTVFACGSPFGSFYPDIFMNTVSKGVLSNTAGDGNVVLLTDARCLPGSEGGGIFLFENGRLYLIGIIVTPLCWKANEWVGLTVACSISHIINNIMKALGKADLVKSKLTALEMRRSIVDRAKRRAIPIEDLMAVVVLVDSGAFWGSGVLLKSRLVLTCRHVVRHSSKVSVKIQNAETSGDRGAFER